MSDGSFRSGKIGREGTQLRFVFSLRTRLEEGIDEKWTEFFSRKERSGVWFAYHKLCGPARRHQWGEDMEREGGGLAIPKDPCVKIAGFPLQEEIRSKSVIIQGQSIKTDLVESQCLLFRNLYAQPAFNSWQIAKQYNTELAVSCEIFFS